MVPSRSLMPAVEIDSARSIWVYPLSMELSIPLSKPISLFRRIDLEIRLAGTGRMKAWSKQANSATWKQVNPVPPFASPAKSGALAKTKPELSEWVSSSRKRRKLWKPLIRSRKGRLPAHCYVPPISLALPQGCHSDSPLARQNPVSTRRSSAGRRDLSASRRIPSGTTLLSDSGISAPEPEKISH